ncbi:unnamed protein product [Penicillium salamii]|uniref:Uncharacterized protein n=1 Tax=Penicillium salamii TaxID=1612424 RepID=A0A9W4MZE1_9EURO|nr:unnamed protein product [Penicillium salamii]
MALLARKKAHLSAGSVSEATPLLKGSARNTEEGRNQRLEDRASTKRFRTQTPLERQTIPTPTAIPTGVL